MPGKVLQEKERKKEMSNRYDELICMKDLIKITATGDSSGGKRKKNNCGVSILILLVREAAPVQLCP